MHKYYKVECDLFMCIYVLDFLITFSSSTYIHTLEILHWWCCTMHNTMPFMEALNKILLCQYVNWLPFKPKKQFVQELGN